MGGGYSQAIRRAALALMVKLVKIEEKIMKNDDEKWWYPSLARPRLRVWLHKHDQNRKRVVWELFKLGLNAIHENLDYGST